MEGVLLTLGRVQDDVGRGTADVGRGTADVGRGTTERRMRMDLEMCCCREVEVDGAVRPH